MAKVPEQNTPAWGRLKSYFIDRIDEGGSRWPPRASFMKWLRKDMGVSGRYEPYYADLRGGVVPWALIRYFVKYTQDHWGWDDSVEKAAEETAAPKYYSKNPEWPTRENLWTNDWSVIVQTLKGVVASGFRDRDEMYFSEDMDSLQAALTIVRCIARKCSTQPQHLDDDSAREEGERIIGHGCAEEARFLRRLYVEDPRTVMFPVIVRAPRQGSCIRAGVSVAIPLSDETAGRVCGGQMNIYDLGADEIASPTRYVYLHALGEPPLTGEINQRELSKAQAHCMAYQWAWFSRPSARRLRPLVLLTIGTNKDYVARLENLGFEHTGHTMPGLGRPVMKLAPPRFLKSIRSLTGVMNYGRYHFLKIMVRMYQAANYTAWEEPKSKRTHWLG